MEHKKYRKIRRLGTSETEGILEGSCLIQEKIDGANLSIWFADEQLMIGSRNQILSEEQEMKGGFSEAREHIGGQVGIFSLFGELMEKYETKDVRMFGEWLVSHTIGDYNIDAYKKFYLFDIEVNGENINPLEVNVFAIKYNICHPFTFWFGSNPTEEFCKSFVGQTKLGAKTGEGIVIKNNSFINKYGEPCYAKIVGETFKEENMITFGGQQAGDTEMSIVLKFATVGRVKKVINKIEQNYNKNISMEDIRQIISMTYYDIVTEELKFIMKKGVVDFRRLNHLCGKRLAKIAIGIITGEETSIAFEESLY